MIREASGMPLHVCCCAAIAPRRCRILSSRDTWLRRLSLISSTVTTYQSSLDAVWPAAYYSIFGTAVANFTTMVREAPDKLAKRKASEEADVPRLSKISRLRGAGNNAIVPLEEHDTFTIEIKPCYTSKAKRNDPKPAEYHQRRLREMLACQRLEERQDSRAENEMASESAEEAEEVGRTSNETKQTSGSEEMTSASAAATPLLDLYVLIGELICWIWKHDHY